MHVEAHDFVRRNAGGRHQIVLEFGSLDINGSVRELFDTRHYHGIDLQAGPGVDEIADAVAYRTSMRRADVVVCCEVLEHAPDVAGIVESAWRNLRAGGRLIVTCATDPRAPHSAVDGGPLRDAEHYANVNPDHLVAVMERQGFVLGFFIVDGERGDLYMVARKP